MRYKEKNINKLLFDNEKYIIYDCEENNNEIHIYLKTKIKSCKCPKCGKESNELHSTYERILQDTPIHNKTTWLHIKVYEFECPNSQCCITTFNEVLDFAKKYQVMTDRLLQLILCISIFLSNSSTSLILSFIGVKVSADTIKNIYSRVEIFDDKDIEEIGIDDVATRKGMKYATAIYDLKNHKMIALLEGRDADSIKNWLKGHPKIKTVARDRTSAYATAISEILPGCMQVADRYHLFENLFNYLKDIFYSEIPDKVFIQNEKILDEPPKKVSELKVVIPINILEKWDYDNTPPIDSLGHIVGYDSKKHDLESKQYIRQANNRTEKYNKIKQLREEFKNNNDLKFLSEKYKFSIVTIKKYISLTDEEIEKIKERKNYKTRKTIIDNYINIIYKMLRDNKTLYEIMNYIIYKGYSDNCKDLDNLKQYIYIIAKNNFPNIDHLKYYPKNVVNYIYPKDIIMITKSNILKNILTINSKVQKDTTIDKYLEKLKEKYPIIEEVQSIFKNFHSIIMGG